MIDSSISSLFEAINNSREYREYLSITSELNSNKEVMNLIEEIKSLEKEATYLEHNGDDEYKKVDKLIGEKTELLNSNSSYKEYLNKLKNFNNTLMASSSLIEDYINEKISI